MTVVPLAPPARLIELEVDGRAVRVPEGSTILDALRGEGVDTPTLCFADNLTPVNACRVCVVELEGSRVLVPSCARKAEAGMKVKTDSERVRLSRKMVLEFLGSSVDVGLTGPDVERWQTDYGADPARYGAPAEPAAAGERDARHAGHHHEPVGTAAETVHQPVKVDNELYVRDYSKCILCYKCVEACGVDAQNTFAISVAGRGFDARISTEFDVGLPDSACVYCGNCIGVCPTGALMFTSEHEMREAGTWDESQQTVTETICPYCGVGCDLEVHVQDNSIVKVTSPSDNDVTSGHLCIKGRFGFQFVQNRAPERPTGTRLPEVAGVVLAGGRSTRFGRDKLAEPYRGLPVLQHAVLRLGEVCSEVIVVLAPDAPEPPMPIGAPARFARDPTEGEGPLAGVHAGLLAVGVELALVTGGDMPDLQTRVLLEMLQVAGEADVEAVALQDGEGFRPLPSVVRTARAVEVAHALLHDGRRALRDLLDALRTAIVDEATWVALDPERRTLVDVDEPDDLPK